ncbi:MAG TPA: PPC domain-containing protein [Longimicrobium sp.]|nr:PPC domain-containing protein [Longimicrobium sp.]
MSVYAAGAYLARRWTLPTDPFYLQPVHQSMNTLRTAAAGLVLACEIAAPAHAQPGTFPTLRIGQSVSGQISESDPAMFERGRFKVYQFQASPGRRYIITMQAGEFDAYLTLARTVGGITDYLASNDDSGENTDSRLRFTVPAAGTYLVVAQSLGEEGTGPFTLQMDTATIRPPTVQNLTLGTPVQGALTDEDAEYDEDTGAEGLYDLYRFTGRAGQRVRVRMEMGEYSPSVEVGTMQDGQFTALEDVTFGAEGTVLATLAEGGEYYLRAGAYGGVTGEYTLTVTERQPAPAPRNTPVRQGETVQGELREGDSELEDGRLYDAYVYTARAGERLRIQLRSEDFDAYLIVGRMVDGEFQEIASNDDAEGGEDLHSLVEVELPEDGRYVIQATSFSPASEGAYELIVGTP